MTLTSKASADHDHVAADDRSASSSASPDQSEKAMAMSAASSTPATKTGSPIATRTSPSKSRTATRSALSSSQIEPSSAKPRKRAKVSFSEEVLSKDDNGDGNKVVIKEEHGVFLGPLLGRLMVSDNRNHEDQDADESGVTAAALSSSSPSSTPVISFANGSHINEKLSYSESPHGILKSSSDNKKSLGGGNDVEYDNLVVRMGLLKCGHRYQVVVPVPDPWNKKEEEDAKTSDKDDEEKIIDDDGRMQTQHEPCGMDVRIVEDSLDGDLRGEVESEFGIRDASSSSSSEATLCKHHVGITLSARRRGPYRGRFVLELTRKRDCTNAAAQTSKPSHATTPTTAASNIEASSNQPTKKYLMSLQVDATIMGKDMGTPKLRNGVVCLGKMVGYDSDEETEWQGFD
mmetsp:Transcript_19450/g.41026  ORF Transcript_19450/g.41026 Transcript_19450/m.41026 type:complete len:403 (+) Transcript_19450:74-1282(+)